MNFKLIIFLFFCGVWQSVAVDQPVDNLNINKTRGKGVVGYGLASKDDSGDKLNFKIGDKLKISYEEKNGSMRFCDYGEVLERTRYDYNFSLIYVSVTNVSNGRGHWIVMAENPLLPPYRRYDKKNLGDKIYTPIKAERWDGSDPR